MYINSIGNHINNTRINVNHKGYAQDIKELKIWFDTDHRLKPLEKRYIRGIDKTKNIKVIDELFKFFEGELGHDIYRAYYAVLDSNDEVNKYAKNALLALANGKSTSIITNFKNINKEGSKSYKLGLAHLADLIQTCKDNKGNHNKKALNLLGELETQDFDPLKIPTYIDFCKGCTGEISDLRVKYLKDFISKGYHIYTDIIKELPDSKHKVNPKRIDFFYRIMDKYKKQDWLNPEILPLAKDLLAGTKESENNNEIEWFSLQFESLLNDNGTVRWNAEYFKDHFGNIPWRNVESMMGHVIPDLKSVGYKGLFPPDLLKDNRGLITTKNQNEYFRLISAYNFSDSFISDISKLKEIKDSNGYIDENFINLIINNIFYFRETPQVLYPAEILKEVLRIAKNKDGSTNWSVANDIINPVYLLFRKKGEELRKLGVDFKPENNEYSSYKDTYLYCSKLEKMIKQNDKFSQKQIEQLKKITHDKNGTERLLNVLSGKTLDKLILDKNLYRAEELLSVMKELDNNGRLHAETLNAPIQDFDNLFWAIIEAPRTEENKKSYSEVIELLSKVKELDFNQKDKNGISVLEKIINAENEELLEVIIKNSNNNLKYYPELDWAYNGIQNERFKKRLSKLNLRFEDIENAGKLQSLKILKKLQHQFNSPLCNKEEVIKQCCYNMSKNNKKANEASKACCKYLLEEYGNVISEDLFKKILTWITEVN